MNVKELVIKGTDEIVAYACGRCGLVHKDAERAEQCCPNYVCRYCGEVAPRFRLACETCGELAMVARAKRVPWSEYAEAMVCIDGYDRYISTEDIEEAIEEGDIVLPFVWGCTYTPLRLDIENAMVSDLEEHHEDAAFDDAGALERFVEEWNAKQTDGSYYIDTKTVVVLDAPRFDAMLQEFEFRAAMRGEV